jgi:hypothetical protein
MGKAADGTSDPREPSEHHDQGIEPPATERLLPEEEDQLPWEVRDSDNDDYSETEILNQLFSELDRDLHQYFADRGYHDPLGGSNTREEQLDRYHQRTMSSQLEGSINITLPDGQKLSWTPALTLREAFEIDITLTNMYGDNWTNQGTYRVDSTGDIHPMARNIPRNISTDDHPADIERIMKDIDEKRYGETSFTQNYQVVRNARKAADRAPLLQ